MEIRAKATGIPEFSAGKYLSALARIMYAPQEELQYEVDAARERIKLSGISHWPPETDDEKLVTAYDAMALNLTEH